MNQINARKFGIAAAITGAITYFGCFLFMSILGKEALITISNMFFHGMDFTNIIRMDIPFLETIIGMGLFAIFCGIFAYILVIIYNKLK